MEVKENIRKLCKDKGISITRLEEILGYSNGSISKPKVLPSDRLYEIAKYFSVSMEFLITGKDSRFSDSNADVLAKLLMDSEMLYYVTVLQSIDEDMKKTIYKSIDYMTASLKN